MEAEVLLARALLRLEPPAVRLAARQVGDQLQVRSRDEVGVGKAGGGGRGGRGLDVLHRGQLGGHQVEGALVNLIGYHP